MQGWGGVGHAGVGGVGYVEVRMHHTGTGVGCENFQSRII